MKMTARNTTVPATVVQATRNKSVFMRRFASRDDGLGAARAHA
jgi:hypothetical protein